VACPCCRQEFLQQKALEKKKRNGRANSFWDGRKNQIGLHKSYWMQIDARFAFDY
jgi:hypothetical protein